MLEITTVYLEEKRLKRVKTGYFGVFLVLLCSKSILLRNTCKTLFDAPAA